MTQIYDFGSHFDFMQIRRSRRKNYFWYPPFLDSACPNWLKKVIDTAFPHICTSDVYISETDLVYLFVCWLVCFVCFCFVLFVCYLLFFLFCLFVFVFVFCFCFCFCFLFFFFLCLFCFWFYLVDIIIIIILWRHGFCNLYKYSIKWIKLNVSFHNTGILILKIYYSESITRY